MSGFLDNIQNSETKAGKKSPKKELEKKLKEQEILASQDVEPKKPIELDRLATYIISDGKLEKL